MKKHKWLTVFIAVGMMAAFSGLSQASEGKTLKVGANLNNVPWEFYEKGQPAGFEIDLVNEIAKRMGVEVEYINIPFSGIFAGLLSGKWDLAASSIWIKKERVKMMDFADPYFESDVALATRKDSKIYKLEDMKGFTFGADAGTAHDAWLRNNLDKYGPYEIKTYDNPIAAFLDLQAGRIDGVLADSPTALHVMRDMPELENRVMFGTPYAQALAFRKDDPLRDKVNAIQNEMKRDGTLAAIYKKWFNREPPADSWSVNVLEKPYVPDK